MTPSNRRLLTRVLRWVLLSAGVLAVAFVVAGVRLDRVAGTLGDARDHLDVAAVALEEGRFSDARSALALAEADLADATSSLYGPPDVELIGALPVVSDNLGSLRESLARTSVLTNGGRRILEEAAPLEGSDGRFEVSLQDGVVPLDAIEATRREISALVSQLPGGPREPDSRLLGPIDELRVRVDDEVDRRREQLDVLGRGLTLLADMAGANGERRYLIAVANTAEMRGSGGMILDYGVLESAEGRFTLDAFGRIDELRLSEPVPDAVHDLPTDYLRRWDGFDVTRRWRNANVSVDFALVAPVLEAMYVQATGEPVDGVIQIDPDGLAGIIAGTGPITVPELGQVTAEEVVPLTLNRAYVDFPGIEQRTDVLESVARATFERVLEGDLPSVRLLADQLVDAGAGRHLLVHARSSAVQSQLEYFGVAGPLPAASDEHVALTVQNVSANKLDYYVDTSLRVAGVRETGRFGSLEVTVSVANTAPAGRTEPSYVFGPFNADQRAGLYRGVVSLYVPRGTTLVDQSGTGVVNPAVVQAEDGRTVVGFTVAVPAGSTSEVVLELRTPPPPSGDYVLVVPASPRVRPTTVSVDLLVDGEPLVAEAVADRRRSFAPQQE